MTAPSLSVQVVLARDGLRQGIDAAQAVIDAWSSGDLAGAVNALEEWQGRARVFLNLNP